MLLDPFTEGLHHRGKKRLRSAGLAPGNFPRAAVALWVFAKPQTIRRRTKTLRPRCGLQVLDVSGTEAVSYKGDVE